MITVKHRPLLPSETRLLRNRATSVRRALDKGLYDRQNTQHYENFHSQILAELSASEAFIIRCDPVRIIARDEFDDEGAAWVFDGGDGNYLALFGQDCRPTPRFPSTSFELIFGAAHQTGVGVRSLAQSHEPLLYERCDDSFWIPAWHLGEWLIFTAPIGLAPNEILRTLVNTDQITYRASPVPILIATPSKKTPTNTRRWFWLIAAGLFALKLLYWLYLLVSHHLLQT